MDMKQEGGRGVVVGQIWREFDSRKKGERKGKEQVREKEK